MSIRIALAGNPNSGKTTLFNALTGSHQYVGNWPGVTVEKKEGTLKQDKSIKIIDLPGIYSLSPYSAEEIVSRNYLINDRPDLIINIVDASNLERNLYLTLHLMETKVPMVIALNMQDVLEKKGVSIDVSTLSQQLKCPVVLISALKETGIQSLLETAQNVIASKADVLRPDYFSPEVSKAISSVEAQIVNETSAESRYFYAVKLIEKDEILKKQLLLSDTQLAAITRIIEQLESDADDDTESLVTSERYGFIAAVSEQIQVKPLHEVTLSTSDKIDKVVTNRWLALPIFAVIMYVIYYVSIQSIGDLTIGYVETFFGWVGELLTNGLTALNASPTVISLLIDGALAGVSAVMTFVPQMMILFFFIAILEDSGYMSRIAFIMDRLFRRFGLSGKSFIPFIIGTGCSVPAIMSSRTIENEKDRRMTIILTPFIPCSAKLPVFALMAGALFPNDAWVAPSMYFVGIVMVIISGLILKRTKWFGGKPAPFIMELPPYRFPSMKGVLIHMFERGKSFITKAGTLIFAMSVIIWTLMSFNWQFQLVDQAESILASIGKVIAPIFSPLGYGNWQAAVAQVTGLLAKETMVATFGILNGVAEDSPEIATFVSSIFTQNSAYAFMIFTLLAAPCMAAIGATKRELVSWKETLMVIGFQCGMAYLLSFIAFQIHLFDLINAAFHVIAIPYVWMSILGAIVIACVIVYAMNQRRKAA